MKNLIYRFRADIILAGLYLLLYYIVHYYYPTPQLTWDSFYYITQSMGEIKQNIRPTGYPYFLQMLYDIRTSINLVVWVQYLLHFLSVIILLHTLHRVVKLSTIVYLVLGILFISEPVALYYGFNILSDILFSALTLFWMSSLLLFIHTRKFLYLLIHTLVMLCCIQVRHIALFYPVFSALIIMFQLKGRFYAIISIVILLYSYSRLLNYNIQQNEQQHGVNVFSPFSGWTHTNNALYALPRIKLDPKFIKDDEVRNLHAFFANYFDTGDYRSLDPGSGYLWEQASPMNILRQRLQDSLQTDFFDSWFKMAPLYHKYGTYIQKNFPYEYIMSYMVPNLKTLYDPHDGEMGDFYATPYSPNDDTARKWYYRKYEDFYCKEQVYQKHINDFNKKYYQVRLGLWVLLAIVAIAYRKRISTVTQRLLFTTGTFIFLFYLLTLYSSWFMDRYLLPIYPLQAAFIIITITGLIKGRDPDISTV